jgi:hypothetical protein
MLGAGNGNQNPWRVSSVWLILSSTVYGIWRTWNEIRHNGHPRTEEQILKAILWEVRSRISWEKVFQEEYK